MNKDEAIKATAMYGKLNHEYDDGVYDGFDAGASWAEAQSAERVAELEFALKYAVRQLNALSAKSWLKPMTRDKFAKASIVETKRLTENKNGQR